MKILKILSAALAATLISGAAHAAVTNYTEGVRPDIVGSTRITANGTGPGDTTGTFPGYDLGTLGAGDTIGIYGRIIQLEDYYFFNATKRFSVKFDFDGYTDTTGFKSNSGLVNMDNNKEAVFRIVKASDFPGGIITSTSFFADTNAGSGISANIFGQSFQPGVYAFQVDGIPDAKSAFYDILIQAVPLPAGGLLLLTALGGLGLARRRRG